MADSDKPAVELLPHCVIKRFSDPEDYFRELRVYQAGLPMVPKLLRFGERDWIEIERIDGAPYLDREFKPQDAARLAQTLASFHLHWFSENLCLCHWDNQPRNILRSGDGYFLIDFSESQLAAPEADVSHLFLFWAAEFGFETNQALYKAFLAVYQPLLPLDSLRWNTALKQSLKRFSQRRQRHLRQNHHVAESDFLASVDFLSSLPV